MAKLYRVLRTGISQRDGDGWKNPPIGSRIELTPEAAAHMMNEVPPYVEEVPAASKARAFASAEPKEETE
jgi:hypothetical protein